LGGGIRERLSHQQSQTHHKSQSAEPEKTLHKASTV
jgi:hypothetical protein